MSSQRSQSAGTAREPRTPIGRTAAFVALTLLAAWITAIYAGLIWFLRKNGD